MPERDETWINLLEGARSMRKIRLQLQPYAITAEDIGKYLFLL
jgi:hypothetical protein